jgi:hypothetical protein
VHGGEKIILLLSAVESLMLFLKTAGVVNLEIIIKIKPAGITLSLKF